MNTSFMLQERNGGHADNFSPPVDIPAIDILDWLKIRHLVGESNPYSQYTLERLRNARNRKKRLKAYLRRERAHRARQSLAVKGIML
jgi:hypothetical protein